MHERFCITQLPTLLECKVLPWSSRQRHARLKPAADVQRFKREQEAKVVQLSKALRDRKQYFIDC